MRGAFTLIELLAVVAIATILVGMTVPAVLPAIKRGKINEAVGMIEAVSSQARQLALSRLTQSSEFYGVVIVQPASEPAFVALTYGSSASSATILPRDDGAPLDEVSNPPVAKQVFNRNVAVWCAPATGSPPSDPAPAEVELAAGAAFGWAFQYRTGACIDPTAPASGPIAVGCGFDANSVKIGDAITGTPFQWPSPVRDKVSLRSLDGRHRTGLAIYGTGLISTVEF